MQRRMNCRPQVREHVPTLLAAGLDHALEVGGEDVAALALAAEVHFPPGDKRSQLPFSVIVRRLHCWVVDEAPHGLAVIEDIAARTADALDGQITALFEQSFDVRSDQDRSPLQCRTREGSVPDAVMHVNELPRPEQQLAPDDAEAPLALRECCKATDQVRPTSARTSLEKENEDVALKPSIAIHGVRLPDGKGEQPAVNESCAGAVTLLAKRRQWVLKPCY